MATSLVSALHWLPRGTLKSSPTPLEPSEEEVAAARARAAAAEAGTLDEYDGAADEEEEEEEEEDDDDDEDGDEAPTAGRRAGAAPPGSGVAVDAAVEAALAGLHMELYDEEEGAEGEDVDAARIFGGAGPQTCFASNAEDPYITLQEDEDDEEAGDFVLRDTGEQAASAATAARLDLVAPRAQTWCSSLLAPRTR